MSFIAKIDIGDYKKGDVVPNSVAIVWMNMYKDSPVEECDGKVVSEPIIEDVKPVKKVSKKRSKSKNKK